MIKLLKVFPQKTWCRKIFIKLNVFKKAASSGDASFLLTESRLIETGHSYRAFAWISRILGFGFLISILVNIVFAVLFLNLFPLKRVEPLLLTLSPKSDQVVRIEPFEAETQGFNVMTESLARDYVKMRETVDFQTETERWERVYFLSSPFVFETFKNMMNKQGDGVYETRRQNNVTRSVSLSSVSTLSENPRILQVEWQSIDAQEGITIKRTRWISTITIQYEPTKVKFEDRYMNPLGFVVASYGVSEKEGELDHAHDTPVP